MPTALLLIAHGSRRSEANDDLHWIAGELRRRADYAAVEPSYLELTSPTIAEAARSCLASGARRILLVPVFLSPGLHVREHLAAARNELATAHPATEWQLCEPIGRHPLLLEILSERIRDAGRTD